MKRFIENYDGKEYDVVVVGGGITGAAVAYDAASRGFSVALVEKQDFGWATSSATSKLIHGGFRYLANFEFGIVRESLRERGILCNIAPNLVYPIRVLVPCYNHGLTKHTSLLRAGMFVYDSLSFDKGRAWDASKKIGMHRVLTPGEALEIEPSIPGDGLKRVFSYYDCASIMPERLTLAFIKSAVMQGADVANYCKVERFLPAGGGGGVGGVVVRDLLGNGEVELRGKVTVNCGGPWADVILGKAVGGREEKMLTRSEGIHIITRKPAFKSMVAMITSTGEGCFVVPWRGCSLIGLTDKEYAGDPDNYSVTKEAVHELIEIANTSFKLDDRIEFKDVIHTYGGLRPLAGGGEKSVRASSRRYEICDNASDGVDGLITVVGGKYTTSRNLAVNAVNMVAGKLNRPQGKSATDKRYLAGCEIQDINKFVNEQKAKNSGFDAKTVENLCHCYGAECGRVFEIAGKNRPLSEPLNGDGEIAAQAVYAAREEMARTLSDIIMRRTGLGTLGHPGADTISRVADVAAEELHWDNDRKLEEIRKTEALFSILH